MADAGYGSFENYMYCTDKKMELDMKYSMYAKKNEPKYKKNNKNLTQKQRIMHKSQAKHSKRRYQFL